MFVIKPVHPWWQIGNWVDGRPLPEGFHYSSNENSHRLTIRELKEMIDDLVA